MEGHHGLSHGGPPRRSHEFVAALRMLEARRRDEGGPCDSELYAHLDCIIEALRIAIVRAERYYGEWT